jgi:hypothetical protein
MDPGGIVAFHRGSANVGWRIGDDTIVLSASWKGLIPDPRQGREDGAKVAVQLRAHAAQIQGSRAAALALPAEEIARSLVVHDSGETWSLVTPFAGMLATAAIEEVERGAAPLAGHLGLLAFSNAILSGGGSPRHTFGFDERALVDRERAWLRDVVARPHELDASGRRLAALAALALDGAVPAGLSTALPSKTVALMAERPDDHERYHDVVAQFPDEDLTWSELLFAARAHQVRVRRSHEGAGRALRELVRNPRPVPPPAAVEPLVAPPSPELVARAGQLFGGGAGPSAVRAWTEIHFRHRHGLWGGSDARVLSTGAIAAVGGAFRPAELWHRATLSAAGMAELDALVVALLGDLGVVALPIRNGVPDETSALLTIATTSQTHSLRKWDRDPHDSFNRLRDWLDAAAKVLVATAPGAPLA